MLGLPGFSAAIFARSYWMRVKKGRLLTTFSPGRSGTLKHYLANRRSSFVLHNVTQLFWRQFGKIYNHACLASLIHYQYNPVKTMKSSGHGIMNMLDLALGTKAKVLHNSTNGVYGDPPVDPQISVIKEMSPRLASVVAVTRRNGVLRR